MDRARTDRGRARLRRLLRLLIHGIVLLAVLAAGGVTSFQISERWIVGSTVGAAPPGPIDLPRGVGEISFASGNVTLTGELALPPGEGPHPAMVVVHGSGRARSGHYRWVAEAFAAKGFAVLTYDKRGVGRSTGHYTGVGPGNSEEAFADLSSDALAGVRWLRQHPAVDAGRTGLFGVSQAGWIIPLAAARSNDVRFMVIVSGPTVTVGEEIYYSDLTGDDQGRPTELSDEEIARRLAAYSGPLGFDPVPSLEKLGIPGLWILGRRDRSIPIPETLKILDELRRNGGKGFTVEVFPEGDHSLRDAMGSRIDYLPAVEAWLRQAVLGPPTRGAR